MELSVLRRADFTDALYREFGAFVAARNVQPAQHIGYLGHEPADVTAELREVEGEFAAACARTGGDLVGLLAVDCDTDIDRVYLLGPWAESADLQDRLYAAVRAVVPEHIVEYEIFCDVANTAVIEFAQRQGFGPPGEQFILCFDRTGLAGLPPVTLPLLTPEHHDQFAALHDRAFPNTHAPAAALLAKDEPIRVVIEDGRLLGYVVLALRPEYDDAQVDYIAVDESARGNGIGARMLIAALHAAFADDRFTHMSLVTNNPVARHLYEKVGFTLRHEMRSFRSAG